MRQNHSNPAQTMLEVILLLYSVMSMKKDKQCEMHKSTAGQDPGSSHLRSALKSQRDMAVNVRLCDFLFVMFQNG